MKCYAFSYGPNNGFSTIGANVFGTSQYYTGGLIFDKIEVFTIQDGVASDAVTAPLPSTAWCGMGLLGSLAAARLVRRRLALQPAD